MLKPVGYKNTGASFSDLETKCVLSVLAVAVGKASTVADTEQEISRYQYVSCLNNVTLLHQNSDTAVLLLSQSLLQIIHHLLI